jgi:hypothetical protein
MEKIGLGTNPITSDIVASREKKKPPRWWGGFTLNH